MASVLVNGGLSVSAGTTFDVVVTLSGVVTQDTGVSIAKLAGEALTGTTTGTILLGTDSVTLHNLALFAAATAQTIEATQTSGDAFAPIDSPAFDVVAGSVSRADTTALGQPQVNVGFSVQVNSTDGFDNPQVVSQDTVVHLTLGAGTGTLSGGLTGTILAGTSTVTIAGVLYDTNEAGVTVIATSTSGDSIGPMGVHTAFNVGPAFVPTFSPDSGDFATGQTVTITSATAGGTIYYTTDGTTPTHLSASIANGGTVNVNQSMWLKAIEVAAGFIDSPVGNATYVIAPVRANGVFEPGPQFATRTESPAASVDGTNLGTQVIG